MTKKLILLLIVISLIGCSKPQQLEYKVNLTLETDVNKVLDEGDFNTYRWIAAFAVDDEGSIYIVDNMSNDNRLIKVDKNGKYQWSLNTNGQGPGEFLRITDVCCWQDKVFVCDQNKKRIIIFSNNGSFIDEFKIELSAEPLRISNDSNGLIYVYLDIPIKNFVLHKYNQQGEYLGSIIKARYNKNDWREDWRNDFSFCIDRDNTIILAFYYSYIIYKYDVNGSLLKTWERKLPYKPEKPKWVKPAPNEFMLKGDLIINDIAVDSHDRLYVIWGCRGNEQQGMQVDLFSPQGKLLSEFYTGINPFDGEQLIAIGPGDDFYVANQHEEPNIYRFILEITKR